MKPANVVWLGLGIVLALAAGSYFIPRLDDPKPEDGAGGQAAVPAEAAEAPAGTQLEEATRGYVVQGAPPSLAQYADDRRRDWVAANEPALSALNHPEAVSFTPAPHAFDVNADKVLVNLDGLVTCRLVRGFQRAGDGDRAAGLAEFIVVLKFARAAAASGANLVVYTRGRKWEEQALKAILHGLADPPWPATEEAWSPVKPAGKLDEAGRQAYRDLLAAVLEPVDEKAAWTAAIAGQRELARRTLEAMNRGDAGIPVWVAEAHQRRDEPGRAKLVSDAEAMLDQLAGELAAARAQQLEPPEPPVRSRGVVRRGGQGGPGTPFRNDPLAVGNACNEARMVPLRVATWRQAVAAQVALRLWHSEHGKLPESWKPLLEAGLLAEPPLDVYRGKPLALDAKQALVWSPGTYSAPVDPKLVPLQGWRGNVWHLTFAPLPQTEP